MKNTISMTQFVATIANGMGIPAPKAAKAPFSMLEGLLRQQGMEKVKKVLIYNPDAVGQWLFQKYTEWFAPVLRHTQLGVPICTVLPSVTPVCFGTMYTGVEPSVHGIQKYEKHVLRQESLFDVLAAAGKKTALVAVENSSMAILFQERNMDYFILPYDGEVTDQAEKLIRDSDYEVIVVYNQESEQSLAALKHHIAAFDRLAGAAEECWKSEDSLLCWATDHGIHTNEQGHGTHGADMEEDLNVMHFFGAWKGAK